MVQPTASVFEDRIQAAANKLLGQDLVAPSLASSMASSVLSSSFPSSAAASAGTALRAAASALTSHFMGLPGPARLLLQTIVLTTAFMMSACYLLYTFHHGFRRTVQFWSSASPIIANYFMLKWKHKLRKTPDEEWKRKVLPQFHRKTAPEFVAIIMRMGGIYVKIGQFLGTLGAVFMDDAYVQALSPLQDGIPPRPMSEIRAIVEKTLGRPMEEVFESFDPKPVGAASIAQAHRARLKHGVTIPGITSGNDGANGDDVHMKDVIVKVQYPEVARNYEADFDNLDLVIRLLQPERREGMRVLRQRHLQELDFRNEASHLRECASNLQHHRLEPQRVRIPRVVDELVTKEVLVMEYLQGTSLKVAMDQELDEVASALGMNNGRELRKKMMENMKQHFMDGGGEGAVMSDSVNGNDSTASSAAQDNNRAPVTAMTASTSLPVSPAKATPRLIGGGSVDGNKSGPFSSLNSRTSNGSPNAMLELATLAAPLVRTYASTLRNIKTARIRAQNGLSLLGQIATLGQWKPTFVQLPSSGDLRRSMNIDLSKVIKTLVMVHGVQVILDGVYNADPHPGNVIIMEDGRLGLIDYGMVGRLDLEERELIASTMVAFQKGDDQRIVDNYRSSGYLAGWLKGGDHGDAMYKRFATFHMDRVDLSPVKLENGDVLPILEVLSKSNEQYAPDWIEQMRRVGGLMMGTASQAGRPISLSKEWKPMAKRFLASSSIDEKQRAARAQHKRDGNKPKGPIV